MQTIYSPGAASNIAITAQKRTLRPVLAQTQGFPYPAYIDPSLRNSDGSIRIPLAADTTPTYPLARSANAFTYEGSIVPGTVMVKTSGENVCVANGATGSAIQPMGLLGQFIGGTFDNLGQNNEISVWMGPDSTYDLIAPGWNDTGLAAAVAAAGAGVQVLLYAGADGRLEYLSSPGSAVPVARLIERWDSARITVQLLV